MTSVADVVTYVELFADLEKPACFGNEAGPTWNASLGSVANRRRTVKLLQFGRHL